MEPNKLDQFDAAREAIKQGNLDRLKRIIDDGLDPNHKGGLQDFTLLTDVMRTWQISEDRKFGLIQLLLAAGSDIHLTSGEGQTPIECAPTIRVAAYLIANGAEVTDELATRLVNRFDGRKRIIELITNLGLLTSGKPRFGSSTFGAMQQKKTMSHSLNFSKKLPHLPLSESPPQPANYRTAQTAIQNR